MWRIYAHSISTKAASVHLSLVASRWGHPTGRVWFFSHSIGMKSSLDIWSVFLQDGVTLFGSESHVLISSEGIGLLEAFFRPVLGGAFLSSFGRPVCSEVGEGSTFSCRRFWRGFWVYPSRQRRSGSWPFFFFWPCCLSPSPGGSVCFGGLFYTWCLYGNSPVLLGSP